MKRTIYLLAVILLIPFSGISQERDCRNWIIPRYLNLQFAGGIGQYVIGAGYTLNKAKNLHLSFQYGFTPKHESKRNLHTTAVKFSYLPFEIDIYKGLKVHPSIGVGISRVFADGPGTFTRLPEYYPDGYYAPNAFRGHLNLGAVFKYQFNEKYFIKALEWYVETTTNDLYILYYVSYDPFHFYNIFSMALGVNIYMGKQ